MEEKIELLENVERSDLILNKGMLYADAFVNKNYLINLNCYPVIPLEEQYKRDHFIRLYRIERIVYDVDEISNDKLISVYSALSNIDSTGVLVMNSNEHGVDFYLGVLSEKNAVTAGMILEKSFKGNFPGSRIHNVLNSEIPMILDDIIERDVYKNLKNVASVSIVPSERDDDKKNFVQGIEKFIDSMIGETYTAIFIAMPINKELLEQRKRGLLKLYSNLSSFATMQLSYGENHSTSITNSLSENFSMSLNDSLTDTNSTSETISKTKSKTKTKGWSFGLLGMGTNGSTAIGTSSGYSLGNSWAKAITKGTTETKGSSTSSSDTETEGNSRTVTINYENKSVKAVMDKIEEHLERIKKCESFGLWDCACYFISEDIQTSVVAANTYKALMAGNGSGVENSFVNIWGGEDEENTERILEYLRYCRHPQMLVPRNEDIFEIKEQIITPASLISGQEVPIIMGLPRKSISGLTALTMAEFGRNVSQNVTKKDARKLDFGYVYHMGKEENNRVVLDIDSLTSHCFITGSTGSGKSNTTYKILDELIKVDIPFLIVEPAKGEYKRYYGKLPGLNIFCTNPNYFSMLKINPFKFNTEIHILEHLDRLIEIFNACWPLYAAMPAILKQSFEEAYIRCGWDLKKSIYISNGKDKFPTFQDILEILPQVINSSSYSSDSKGDYTGALVTRVNSLTNGVLGQIFCDASDISDKILFDEYTIVDLSRVSSLETKALIMGILILKLNEYRLSVGLENQPLRHVTVLEEAHNLLKRTGGSSGGQEGADLQGKSVEMISSSIAEMRTFGEGFIIVDQSPTAVDASAVKNTNTKIIMRLPDYEDCNIAGKALALDDNQIREIAKFPMGVAAVYQNNWLEAVLTKIDKSKSEYYQQDIICTNEEIAQLKGILVTMLIMRFESEDFEIEGFGLAELLEVITEYDISKYKRQELVTAIIDFTDYFKNEKVNNETFGKKLTKFVDCDGLFRLLPLEFNGDYEKVEKLSKSVIDEKDRKAVKEWYKDVLNYMNEYVVIESDSIRKRLVRYLLLHKRIKEGTTNRYHIIYQSLYGKN